LGANGGAAGGEVRAMTAVRCDGVGSSNRTDVGVMVAEVGADGDDGIRAGGGSSSNGTIGCGTNIDVACCSSTTYCRLGSSVGSTSIDIGCCSSMIYCRSRWSAGSNVACCSSMTRCGSGWRAGISYITAMMAPI
jgi:hypothetical protein